MSAAKQSPHDVIAVRQLRRVAISSYLILHCCSWDVKFESVVVGMKCDIYGFNAFSSLQCNQAEIITQHSECASRSIGVVIHCGVDGPTTKK